MISERKMCWNLFTFSICFSIALFRHAHHVSTTFSDNYWHTDLDSQQLFRHAQQNSHVRKVAHQQIETETFWRQNAMIFTRKFQIQHVVGKLKWQNVGMVSTAAAASHANVKTWNMVVLRKTNHHDRWSPGHGPQIGPKLTPHKILLTETQHRSPRISADCCCCCGGAALLAGGYRPGKQHPKTR